MHPRVVHCKRDRYDVYVGRPSKWGNPFSHLPESAAGFKVSSRQEAIDRYREWVVNQPDLMADLPSLAGKVLGCWCHPRPCHAEVLAEMADELTARTVRDRVIAVDFDGTCVTHAYPEVGKDVGAIPVLRKLARHHRLILWTMRSGRALEEAKEWFADAGIALWGVNRNPEQDWSDSPKAYAQLYVDDAAAGCPLSSDPELSGRPFVNWRAMEEWLVRNGYLT